MKIIISESLFEKAQQTRQEIVSLFREDGEFSSFAEERKALVDATAGRIHVSVGTSGGNFDDRIEISVSDELVGATLGSTSVFRERRITVPVQAATSRQQWLVDKVLRPLEQDEPSMKRLRYFLQKAIESKRPTASMFRSFARGMVSKPADSNVCLSTPDVHFCLLWLWVNTLSMPVSEFAVSASPKTADALAELIISCFIPYVLAIDIIIDEEFKGGKRL